MPLQLKRRNVFWRFDAKSPGVDKATVAAAIIRGRWQHMFMITVYDAANTEDMVKVDELGTTGSRCGEALAC